MNPAHATHDLVGRGNHAGAQLFREWFEDLNRAAEQDQRGAYVFVMGSLAELLRVFDFPLVFPEINFDKVDEVLGMDIIICTNAKNDTEAKALLKHFNMPFTS